MLRKIDTRDKLELWLADKPPELAAVISGRVALRVLPIALRASIPNATKEASRLAQAVFRCAAVSCSSFHIQDRKMVIRGARAAQRAALHSSASVASTARAAAASANVVANAISPRLDRITARVAARAAARASNADSLAADFGTLVAVIAADAIVGGGGVADCAAEAADFAAHIGPATAIWDSISTDCLWWEERRRKSWDLLARRLWPSAVPDNIEAAWQQFCSAPGATAQWSEWIEWYERKVKGSRTDWGLPAAAEHEMGCRLVRGDGRLWSRGPSHGNSQIAKWLRELTAEKFPSQDKTTICYGSDATGRIVRLPVPLARRLTDSPAQRRTYAEMRNDILLLSGHGQQLGNVLARAIDDLLQSLPEDFHEAEVVSLWRDFFRVSGILAKHLIALRSNDYSNDLQDETCAVDLQAAVAEGNLLILGCPRVQAMSALAQPAQLHPDIHAEAAAARPLVTAMLAEPELAEEAVRRDVRANLAAIELAADNATDALLADKATRTQRNIIGALIAGARNFARGVKDGANREVGKRLLDFMIANRETLVDYGRQAYGYISPENWTRLYQLFLEALKHWRK